MNPSFSSDLSAVPRPADEPQENSNWTRRSIIFLLPIITALFLYFNLSSRSIFSAKDTDMDTDTDTDTSPVPSPNLRTQFGPRTTLVRGFPSKGGIYLIEEAGLIELEFLSLDRFHETLPSDEPAEEDAFCQRMRGMGAQWFENEREADNEPPHKVKDGKMVGRMEVWLGWPQSGGVWVLEVEEFEGARKGVGGRIRNAMSMEERCRFIEMLGGVFFRDRRDCPLTRDMIF